jgi:GTPase
MPDNPRAGFIALIGAPNAGKSTLINRLVGTKIAIVTHKVQTTRTRLLGIAIHKSSQLIFIDTPGIFTPRRRLDRAMVSAAWRGAGDADHVVVLVDAVFGITADVERIMKGLGKSKRKAILAINKIDTIKKDKLLALSQKLNDTGHFSDIFMISALKGDGVDDLKNHLAERVEEGPWLYPEDQLSDVTQRMLASEITREKIFLRLHQELPYAIWVATEKWENKKDGSVRIEQVIHVERETHKGIVIGKGGKTLKAIGASSREELEQALNTKVHLFLFVKVSERWGENPYHYSEMGLEFVE